MNKFKVYYDDQPNDGVDRLSSIIEKFGIQVFRLEGGDGFEEFEVVMEEDYKAQVERLEQQDSERLIEISNWERCYHKHY